MENNVRDSFIFYRSFLDAINEASDKEQLELYRVIARYALNRDEPQLSGLVKAVWLAIRPQLDANWKRYNNGKKGGAPCGNSNAVKQPKNNQKQPKNNQKQPNVNDNENDNENENLNENDFIMTKRTAFVPPTVEEVIAYLNEKGIGNVDAERFVSFYESKGWMIGKNKMKSWKAAVATWSKTQNERATVSTPRRTSSDNTKSVNDEWC